MFVVVPLALHEDERALECDKLAQNPPPKFVPPQSSLPTNPPPPTKTQQSNQLRVTETSSLASVPSSSTVLIVVVVAVVVVVVVAVVVSVVAVIAVYVSDCFVIPFPSFFPPTDLQSYIYFSPPFPPPTMNQPPRARTSRRSRPSLAAFTDSGYEPSCPPTHSRKSPLLGRSSFTRNTNVLDELDREFKSQLLTDIFTDPASSHNPVSYRGPPMNHTMRSTPSPLPSDAEPAVGSISSSCGGRGGGGTITANSNSNGYGYGRSNSSVYPRSISRSGTISSAWSGVSSRLFMDSTLGGGPADARQSNDFTVQFDRLAKKHGIQPFPHGCKGEPAVSSTPRDPSSGESAPALSGSRFWNRLLGRTPSTVDAPKLPGSAKLTRRHPTVSDLAAIGRGKRDSLRGMHLEHMIRLGGVAIFNLPLGLAPGDLLIPTCIHAAAQFLLNNGKQASQPARQTCVCVCAWLRADAVFKV